MLRLTHYRVFLQRALKYDGYGRPWRRTTPEQGQTTYSYYANDWLQTITDARGATQTFAYNGRHLATGITFGVPAGVAPTPNVTFSYDATGNRTGMSDGHGSVSYSYDTLSRLTQETRTFSGVGTFTLTYGYNLAGQLTSITNPWSAAVGYSRDQTGQVTQVTGANYYGVSSYASNLQYRASGAVKWLQYGNGRTLSVSYDNRLRMTRWDVAGVLGSQYAYATAYQEHSFRVMFADQLYDDTLDRSYDYDQVGRLHVSYTGAEARAHAYTGQWGVQDGPYAQGQHYDVWGNIVERLGWGGENAAYTASFTGNRRNGASYDAAGNITGDGGQAFTYDATGQQAWASHLSTEQGYDGDRLRVRRTENGVTTYYLRSSVLGGRPVAEITSSGGWARGYVYLGSQLLALQQGGVEWVHQDPVTKSQRLTDVSGNVTALVELDPWGGETSRSVNSWRQPQRYTTYLRDGNQSDEAMHRRYNRWWQRFDQPDPYDGSYDLSDPQSLNRYAYVQNDPVNFVDPDGLWPWWIHNQIIDEAFRPCLSQAQREILYQASSDVDSPRSLVDTSLAYQHKLRSSYRQRVTQAAERAENFIRVELSIARLSQANAGGARSGSELQDSTLRRFGTALHTITDGFSPSHIGYQVWDPGSPGGMALHFARESHLRGRNRELYNQAVAAARTVFRDTFGFDCEQQASAGPLPQPGSGPSLLPIGGGDGGGGGFLGGGGYPSWYYSMWGFVAWVNSIPVGRRTHVTVIIEDVDVEIIMN